ncbi:MAG: DNA polymerase III subunit alpha, partial [Candidatus Scalindua sp.]|nr:DNA polymerase III subunit alpha [Candidatus Scalindua sp.]
NKSSETQPSGQGGNFHLVLIAQNWKGYQNLCSLSNFAYTEGFYFAPRIDFDLLAKHSEGLICSSACLKGIVNQNLLYDKYDEAKKAAMMFKEIFGDRFFLEVMYHGIPAELKIIPEIFKLSKELDIPVIATNDVHYVTQDQALSQEVLTCMSTRTCLSNPKRLRQPYSEFYLKSADEMHQMFKKNPNCITNTVAIANMVDHEDIKKNLFVKRMRLPEFETPDGFNSPIEYLKDLADKGMIDLGWEKSEPHIEALKKELADIQVAKDNNNYDFATYFLIVWDIANFARREGIFMAPGRGSGYASVLLRCLKVCYGPDPLEYGLFWERFLAFKNDEVTGKRVFARPGFPDIDSDFDFFRRGEIYDYIIEKYGRENVENIGTYIGLKLRMSLTRVIKALDIAQAFHKGKQEFVTENMAKVEEILGQLPKAQGAFMKAKDKEGEEVSIKTIEDAIKYCPDFKYYMDKYPDIVTHTKNVQGLLSSFSKHPAGIVIADVPVHQLAPVRRSKKDQYASQFDMNDLESMGLIKLDILATSILTVIDRTVKMVKSNYDIDIDVENLNLKDEKTFELYRRGKLKGVFQCENGGMQQTMRDIGVSSFDDVVAAIALYRPGPMGSIPEYCERKKGLTPVSYFHPTIEPFVKPYLKKTHGILIYQEQIMQICNSLAGISVADGYILIKGIGKKKEHLISQYKVQFIDGCVGNGVPADISEQYWDTFIIPFASYGFNLAHALAYGYVSWISAYLKANYTAEFMVCSLDVANEDKKHDKIIDLERDLKKMNIKLADRDLNTCDVKYRIVRKEDKANGVDQTIVSPSLMVKGVGLPTAQNIADNKPYKSLKELASKTDFKLVNKETIAALAESDFFSKMIKEYYKATKKRLSKGKLVEQFMVIRNDLKKAAKKGVESMDLFG